MNFNSFYQHYKLIISIKQQRKLHEAEKAAQTDKKLSISATFHPTLFHV